MTDLALAMLYIPKPKRAHVEALFALDRALGDVVRSTSEPMIGRIRLAWWRERLEELDEGKVPDEPHLQAIAEVIAATGITGKMLAPAADFWAELFEPFPWEGEVAGWIARRGAELFGYASMVLHPDFHPDELRPVSNAGAWWAGMDVARHVSRTDEQEMLRDVVLFNEDKWEERTIVPELRPLTMLGILAQRDARMWPRLEPQATPARAWAMITHKLTGKIRI